VRTLGECVYEARRGLESLTALLSARPLAGPELLTDLARKVAVDTARAEGSGFVDALRTTRAERAERHGRFGRAQEPDLKEGLGGLRDLQLAGWLQVALGVRPAPAQAAELDDGLDLVLAVRTALHRVTGAADNRLALGHQGAVAAELAFEPEPGWEPADLLMRTLARVGRSVSRVIDEL